MKALVFSDSSIGNRLSAKLESPEVHDVMFMGATFSRCDIVKEGMPARGLMQLSDTALGVIRTFQKHDNMPNGLSKLALAYDLPLFSRERDEWAFIPSGMSTPSLGGGYYAAVDLMRTMHKTIAPDYTFVIGGVDSKDLLDSGVNCSALNRVEDFDHFWSCLVAVMERDGERS